MNPNAVHGTGIVGEKHRGKKILQAASRLYGIPEDKLISRSRKQRLVEVRRMCCYAMRTHTALTYYEISDLLGGRDHSTLIHAFQSAQDYIDMYGDYHNDYKRLIEEYKNLLTEDGAS